MKPDLYIEKWDSYGFFTIAEYGTEQYENIMPFIREKYIAIILGWGMEVEIE